MNKFFDFLFACVKAWAIGLVALVVLYILVHVLKI